MFSQRRRESLRYALAILVSTVLLTACQEEILHDLSEREANKVIRHLNVANLTSTKVQQPDGRWAIAVDRGEIVSALAHLDTQRVLSQRDGLAQPSKGSIIPSREDQRFRYERALATSIEESLAAIPGVLEPRVHINMPDQDPLFPAHDARTGSGSVLLVVDASYGASDHEISALVAGAAGISREAVRVLKSAAPTVTTFKPDELEKVGERRTEIRATTIAPWAVVAMGGVFVFAFGARWVFRGRTKRATFPLPKELDFEG